MITTSTSTLRRLAWLRRNRCGALLAALFLFILADPAFARATISVAFLLLGVVAIVALALFPFRAWLFATWSALLLLMVAAETLVAMRTGIRWFAPLGFASTATFTAIVIVELLRYVMDARPITADKVFAAVSAYVLVRLGRWKTEDAVLGSAPGALSTVLNRLSLAGRMIALEIMRAGFVGKMAIHPAQVSAINAAFTPTEAERAHARAIVDAFAAAPGAGVVSLDGRMVDRPHLVSARRVLGLS